ncbi:MAG: flippase-like domain-containing protein [Phycisphaeraceae bacterium]|nr:flippase-like domain-containing protein [Phycisphaeraceae bacterium]
MSTNGHGNRAPRGWRGVAIQVVGLAVGLALLGWCVSVALRPENRDQLGRLREAPPWMIAGVVGLSAGSLVFNAAVFWSLIRPARKLGFGHVLAVNCVATCLAYLPFKLSLVFRFFVHRVRDGIPVPTIAAWVAAAGMSLVVVCGPVAGVAALGLRGVALIPVAAGVAVAVAWGVSAAARAFAGSGGMARIRCLSSGLGIVMIDRAARTRTFEHLQAGFGMVGERFPWWAAIAFRAGDLAVQSARFWIAARILGLELDIAPAVVLGVTYYALGAASPSGAIGIREGGATGVAALLHLDGGGSYAGVTLLVSAADAVPTVLAAMSGALLLRRWGTRVDRTRASG